MRLEDIMGYAAIFFGILGSWFSVKQAHMIWSSKSALSVSGTFLITFVAMFASLLIYGVQQDSFYMGLQGGLRVSFLLPIVAGFFKYGKSGKKERRLITLYSLLLAGMWFKPISPFLFSLFSFLGVAASFIQADTIRNNRSRGKVSVELQIILLGAISCWCVYGYIRKDEALFITAAAFIMSYSTTIFMWFKYSDNGGRPLGEVTAAKA